ncbi:PDT-domain-containing protein [Cytidiella melzeri]|nr:PDT-domain-containing protein [Cytidiella melzeri]
MSTDTAETPRPQVLYLGPLGTYTHQVAHDNLGDNVTYASRDTIRDVCEAISPEFPFGVVPQENSTFGSVVDTYDWLRSTKAGADVFIRGEATLAVQHCLVGRKGLDKEKITRILSHEQALGQCRDYIFANFPNAILKKVSSTAAAAQALSEEDSADLQSAAICSAHCATFFDDLEVLQSSIQDKQDNFTRFFVLSHSLGATPPLLDTRPRLLRALVRIAMVVSQRSNSDEEESSVTEIPPPAPNFHSRPLLLIMSTLLTTFGIPITRVDRRPSLSDIPFEDVYFIELEELGPSLEIPPRPERINSWIKRVGAGVNRVKAVGCDATILGVW